MADVKSESTYRYWTDRVHGRTGTDPCQKAIWLLKCLMPI